LRVWQDDTGLAFAFALPKNYSAYGLVRAIRGDVYRTASFCHDGDAECSYEIRGGREVRVIRRLNLTEISPVRAAANPATAVWLDFEQDDELPDHIRDMRARWHAGQPQAKPAQRSGKAPAAPSAKRARVARLDPIIDRIAAGWRPRCWARDFQALARDRRQ
jgi:Caudovirus prohead serine protease